jgi:hypothetical protein
VDSPTGIDDLAVTEQDDPTAEDILERKNAVDAFNGVRVGPDNTMPLGLVGCDRSGAVQAGLLRSQLLALALRRASVGR